VGEDARILFGAVLTAEGGSVELGANTIVMENALVRGRTGHPTRLGAHVLVGPHAHVNGARIEDEVFVATGASLFPGSVAGAGSELRINSVLHVNSRLEEQTVVPIGWIAVGDPAELFPPDRHEELWEVQRDLDFPGTVYGVPRGTPMRTVMARQVEFYGAHRADRVVDGDHPSP
jgi:carbonic anhydrase/acetyltransferase-like protein (isoleucine patch superfamily)